MYCELFTLLDNNVLLLTANQRLTEYLFRDFNKIQLQNKNQTWTLPNIQPLTTWLTLQWQQNPHAEGILLSDTEETLLWQQLITQDDATKAVLQINQAAALAKSAWHTLTQWQLTIAQLTLQPNEEVAKFISLAQSFEQIKTNKKYYTKPELPALVKALVTKGGIALPKKIIFYGFDQYPPTLQALINTLEQHTDVVFFNFTPQNTTLARTTLATEEQEIIAMAHWAKDKLTSLSSREKIGCVIPKLSQKRDKVLRIFTEVFAPDNIVPGKTTNPVPYNLSAGMPLIQYPLIQDALKLLSLQVHKIQHADLQSVLLSPYVNSTADERSLGAFTTIKLNETDNTPLTKNLVQAVLTKLAQENYPGCTLAARWQQFSHLAIPGATRSFKTWVELFQQRLIALGWPGQNSLSSAEYQVMQCWQQVLADFCNLERTVQPKTYTGALAILRDICTQTVFQPQSEDKPIQILGMLEALGCRFSHLWVMGLDDEAWPDKSNPNPFLPIELQRKHQMPHASAERELEFATRTQSALIASAAEVILSHASTEEDKTRRPSRLITAIAALEAPSCVTKNSATIIPEEVIQDYLAPSLATTKNIRGGSWILKEQSLCPFRAFASIRLQTKPIEQPQLGLSAKIRGIVTHTALDLLWKQLNSQQQLTELPDTAVNQLILQSIEQAFVAANLSQTLYQDVERERLHKLLQHWLTVEKNRPPFRVLERESTRFIKIGELAIRIQIDRVDELENGAQLIIDYKTGKLNSTKNWFGERPREPQLPIYYLYGSENSVGLAYAEVNLANLKFKGLIDSEQTFSQVNNKDKYLTTWNELKTSWQTSLHTLAAEFIAGNAAVSPQNSTEDCARCHLQGLCRIGELT